MKKYFLGVSVFFLLILSSCNSPIKTMSVSQEENKNIVSQKEHTEKGLWYLEMSGKKDNFTSKITNTVFFSSLKAKNGIVPMFIIFKDITASGDISFIVAVIINSTEYKSLSYDKEIKIKLSDNSIIEFDCVRTLQKTDNGIFQTVFGSSISIGEINRLRKENTNVAVRISYDSTYFDFTLPPLFFEYLREI